MQSKPSKAETAESNYTERLLRLETPRWKKLIDVQAPYRWNLRRLNLGFTLDVGCGLGRNLENLGGNGVGVDHNPHSVEVARRKGLKAYTIDEFKASEWCRPERFDSLLVAHVLEHMDRQSASSLLTDYLPYLKKNGWIVVITPQEKGQSSDATHVEFMDFAAVSSVFSASGIELVKQYSFPFPRGLGKLFTYNEFVSLGKHIGSRA